MVYAFWSFLNKLKLGLQLMMIYLYIYGQFGQIVPWVYRSNSNSSGTQFMDEFKIDTGV